MAVPWSGTSAPRLGSCGTARAPFVSHRHRAPHRIISRAQEVRGCLGTVLHSERGSDGMRYQAEEELIAALLATTTTPQSAHLAPYSRYVMVPILQYYYL